MPKLLWNIFWDRGTNSVNSMVPTLFGALWIGLKLVKLGVQAQGWDCSLNALNGLHGVYLEPGNESYIQLAGY